MLGYYSISGDSSIDMTHRISTQQLM